MTTKLLNGEPVEMTAEEIAAQTRDVASAMGLQVDNAKTTARSIRNGKLAACDWTQAPDAPLDKAGKAAWATHRQALRDVPTQAGFPDAVEWPEAPNPPV